MYIKSSQVKLCKGRKKRHCICLWVLLVKNLKKSREEAPRFPMEIPLLRWLKAWGDTNHEAGVRGALFNLICGIRATKTQRVVLTTTTPTHDCSSFLSFLTEVWWLGGWGRGDFFHGTLGLKHKCPRRQGERCMSSFMSYVCISTTATFYWLLASHSPLRIKEKEHWPPIDEREYQEMCNHLF